MTIGISVDGASVAAYACNGTDDEAWFFGNQADGKIDIKSRFRDTLNGRIHGTDVAGDLTMNGVAYDFTAAPVSGAAGMYTADARRRARVVGRSSGRVGHRRAVQRRHHRPRLRQAELQQLNDDAVPRRGAQQAAAAAGRQIVEAGRTAALSSRSTARRDADSRRRHLPLELNSRCPAEANSHRSRENRRVASAGPCCRRRAQHLDVRCHLRSDFGVDSRGVGGPGGPRLLDVVTIVFFIAVTVAGMSSAPRTATGWTPTRPRFQRRSGGRWRSGPWRSCPSPRSMRLSLEPQRGLGEGGVPSHQPGADADVGAGVRTIAVLGYEAVTVAVHHRLDQGRYPCRRDRRGDQNDADLSHPRTENARPA